MTEISAYSFTPREAKTAAIRWIQAGVVPFIQSSPGMGKSAIVAQIAREFGLELIDHRLSTSAPEDLTGLPKFLENGTATFAPFDTFPVEGTPLPEGKVGWLLFLDEFNSASKAVQAAAYKLVLDRAVGSRKLHKNVAIVAAGNLSTDRAIVNPLSTAMQSRVAHIKMQLQTDSQGKYSEFMEDVALKYGWDERIIAYLNYKPGNLYDFRPDHNDQTFCSPRTWDFVNRLIKGNSVSEKDAAIISGAITSGIGVDFINFVKVYDNLPTIEKILTDPSNYPIPQEAPVRYATVTHLTSRITKENFSEIAPYINRLPMEFRVIFLRGIRIQRPELRESQAFRSMAVDLSKYLNEDLPAAA